MDTVLPKFFLLFSNAIIISPLLIIGFITRGGFFLKNPSTESSVFWGNACILVLFTMIFTVFLKSIFQIPLNPTLGIQGFAFPSGHMTVAVIFYGWLFLAYPHWLFRSIILIILTGIGWGLIQQGYHDLKDVGAAVGFGMATIYGFVKISKSSFLQKNPPLMGFYALLISGLMMIGIMFQNNMPSHVVKTYLGLIIFTFMWVFLNRTVWKIKILHKTI
jgi:membrane-associated phospholipid phosphatase